MNPVERAIRRVDRYQQDHGWLAAPVGVIKKFGDDRGGPLTTQLAYTAFFAIFPLLLLLVMGLGIVLGHDPALRERIFDSALREFPIIGTQLGQNIHSLHATGLGLAAGILGLLWGVRGLTQAGQFAMAEIWNIPGKHRPSFWTRQIRGGILLLVFAFGLAVTTVLTTLAGLGDRAVILQIGYAIVSALVNIGLFLLAYRVLTPPQIPTRWMLPGAMIAGVAWEALMLFGGYLVKHNLRHASEIAGFFGVILGLLSWLYLGAQITLLAAEVNVVRARRLWPRGIVQPPLTPEDKNALIDLAKQEERRPEESIEVTFTQEPQENPKPTIVSNDSDATPTPT